MRQSRREVFKLTALIPILALVFLSTLVIPASFLASAQGASPSFVLSATPDELIVNPNSTRISMINVTGLDGFTGSISLSASELPGIKISTSPSTLLLQSSSPTLTSMLTANASSSVALGSYSATITASYLGSQTAVLTLTIVVAATTQLTCGSAGTCFILSDASVSNPSYEASTIHFTATGLSGGTGFANVTIPATATSNMNNTHVFVNGAQLPQSMFTVTSNRIDYFVYLSFTFHSPVNVDIRLSQATKPGNLGLSPIFVYGLEAATVITIAGVGALIVIRRKKHQHLASDDRFPQSLSRRTSGESQSSNILSESSCILL